MLQNILLPLLGFGDVQRLGQVCRTTQKIVLKLSDANLRRLAQVGPAQYCMYHMTWV